MVLCSAFHLTRSLVVVLNYLFPKLTFLLNPEFRQAKKLALTAGEKKAAEIKGRADLTNQGCREGAMSRHDILLLE